MKSLVEFINEAKKGVFNNTICSKIIDKLSEEDKELFHNLRWDDETNGLRTGEEIEYYLYKRCKEEQVDEYFSIVQNALNIVGYTDKDVVDAYSLSRSGKQMKVEVTAQVAYFIGSKV